MNKIKSEEELDPNTDFVRVNIFPPDRYGLDLVCPHQRILAARATLGILAYAQSGQAFLGTAAPDVVVDPLPTQTKEGESQQGSLSSNLPHFGHKLKNNE